MSRQSSIQLLGNDPASLALAIILLLRLTKLLAEGISEGNRKAYQTGATGNAARVLGAFLRLPLALNAEERLWKAKTPRVTFPPAELIP